MFSSSTFASLSEGFSELFLCGGTDWKSSPLDPHQDDHEAAPGLEAAPSGASVSSRASSHNQHTIYALPSREVLEEMVRDSEHTRRQGIFDLDRLWSCGGGVDESLYEPTDDDGANDLHNDLLNDQQDQHDDHDSVSTFSCAEASIFSRLAPGNKNPPPRARRARLPPQEPQPQEEEEEGEESERAPPSPAQHRSAPIEAAHAALPLQPHEQELQPTPTQEVKQEEQPQEEARPPSYSDGSYHYTIHLSPSREPFAHKPHKVHSYQTHPSLTLRRTLSESLSELPEQRQRFRRRHE